MKNSIFTPKCLAVLELAVVAMLSSDFGPDEITNEEMELLSTATIESLEASVIVQNNAAGRRGRKEAIELENHSKTMKSTIKLEYAPAIRMRSFPFLNPNSYSASKAVFQTTEETVAAKISRILAQHKYYNF